MIAELATDLVARVTSVPALAASSSLALGGHGADPALLKIPMPAAWVLYQQDGVDEDPYSASSSRGGAIVPGVQVMLCLFRVVIYVPYVSQDDLIGTQYPLLQSVIEAVRGQDSPSGHRWRYIGQKLALVANDRMAYEQRYTVDAVF